MSTGRLRVVFMGTPDFAVPALRQIIDHGYDVVAVYSQPPRPKGRGQQVQMSPVHQAAHDAGIHVYHPVSLKKDVEAQAAFTALNADVAVVAAYGLILPLAVLKAPRLGCLNIHASLLPRWRGASPIQHAIWHGDTQSGVGIMQMEEGLDTGPVLLERAVPIRDTTTAQSLHDELSALGAVLILEALAKLEAGEKITPISQDNEHMTYAPLLTKEDGLIDWRQDAAQIDRQIRALNPWPGVWTKTYDGKRLKVLTAEALSEQYTEPPGTLVNRHGDVACGGDTGLRLHLVQPENAKAMDAIAAINGKYIRVDEVLG
jgi:methionyl-tRNA formyltransferase